MPELAKYPVEYIYEPWKAPIEVQKKSGCILGKDYPKRIVKHEVAVKENMAKMNKLQQALLTAMTGQVCAISRRIREHCSFFHPYVICPWVQTHQSPIKIAQSVYACLEM